MYHQRIRRKNFEQGLDSASVIWVTRERMVGVMDSRMTTQTLAKGTTPNNTIAEEERSGHDNTLLWGADNVDNDRADMMHKDRADRVHKDSLFILTKNRARRHKRQLKPQMKLEQQKPPPSTT